MEIFPVFSLFQFLELTCFILFRFRSFNLFYITLIIFSFHPFRNTFLFCNAVISNSPNYCSIIQHLLIMLSTHLRYNQTAPKSRATVGYAWVISPATCNEWALLALKLFTNVYLITRIQRVHCKGIFPSRRHWRHHYIQFSC